MATANDVANAGDAVLDDRAAVAERERSFYNVSESGSYRKWRDFIWRTIGAFNRADEIQDLYDLTGKRVLLYGCGQAYEAPRALAAGAKHIAGIDISDELIAAAKTRAEAAGCAHRTEFRAGDAHATGFPDRSFDLIIGVAILHHLDMDLALNELRRMLAPGGRAVFLEPLAHNPLIRLGRLLTPTARTPDEHPLTIEDWDRCSRVFPGFWHREVELTSTAIMPLNLLLPASWQRALAPHVKRLDDGLLNRHPRLRRYARTTFLVLE